jgi:HSP20 family protein
MKFSAPLVAAMAAMYPVVDAYSLWGPSLFEPALTFASPASIMKRQRALFNEMDRTFNEFREVSPRYEISNAEDKLMIAMDVPGVKTEDVDVSVEGNVLTIRGSRKAATDDSSYTSKFTQSFSLDPVVDLEHISANLADGVLTVTAPKDLKRLEQSVKSIPITQSDTPAMLSGTPETKEDVPVKEEANTETNEEVKVEAKTEDVLDLDDAALT